MTASIAIQSSSKAAQSQLVKLITFAIGQLNLAVPIHQVQKVVNLPQIDGSGLYPVGLTQVGDREVTVIDLYRRLFRSEAVRQNADYLVLLQTRQETTFGIPVQDTPLLLEVPMGLIRQLPDAYRRADTLEIASHIVRLTEAERSRTLFLLDVEMLTQPA